MTPEQIVADWLEMPWLDVANDPNITPLIATIRAYGAACAAARQERCADAVRRARVPANAPVWAVRDAILDAIGALD